MEVAFDPRRAKLGEILVWAGVISQLQLDQALQMSGPDQKNLGQVLVSLGHTTEDKIIKAVSLRLGIPFFTSFEGMLEPEAGRLLPEVMARRHLAVPVFRSDEGLTVGMVNPIDIDAIDDISRHTGLRVQPVMTTLNNLFACIQQVYGTSTPELSLAPPELEEESKDVARAKAEDKGIVETVNLILQEGLARQASDIHIEPAEKETRVRFRVDGVLQEGKSFTKEQEVALIARIKILSKLDITETRLPQDGHLRFRYGGRGVDIRVSTLPTVHGEKAVLRILDTSRSVKKVSELGLEAGVLASFSAAIRQPNGLILVTGPTGSGKTTTLYAAMAELNEPGRNIVTLENPVELRVDRINQVETHARIGLTFAAGLRAVLRQDPNVILVGEIRDLETAEIAMQASITGHMVFSTLHTNDAVSAVHRLLNMRVEPFLIGAALRGIMAQRLLRRLCPKCRRDHAPTRAEYDSLPGLGAGPFFEAAGCDACFKTGYSGRFAVHEWFPISRVVRDLILRRASLDELKTAAQAEGMRTLHDGALERASRGETSLEEVLRATREGTEA